MLELAAEVTERALRRLTADATEYAVIGLAVETTAPKLTADAIEKAMMELAAGVLE